MSHSGFVHLRVHTAYSLSEGAIRVKDLAKACGEHRFPAVAITDTNTIAGAAKFTEEVSKAGAQPIVGAQLSLRHDDGNGNKVTSKIVLLVKDDEGYQNLIKLISSAYLSTEDGAEPRVEIPDLLDRNAGLIMLTGGTEGCIDRALLAEDDRIARARLKKLKDVFGDRLYCEIQRLGRPEESFVEKRLIELADEIGVPLVATNEAFFLTPEEHEAHDVLLCIADGAYVTTEGRRRVSPHNHLKSAEDMIALFADLPDAINNTLIIAQRCSRVFREEKPELPDFPTAGGRTEEDELRHQAAEGLVERIKKLKIPVDKHQEYRDRLAFELGVIVQMGFPGYFLIVSDFIKWAKANDISVGPGRGSGAGSLVAFALEITDIDPLRYGLLFERFLNPDRVSMPDFDIDFCNERRTEVIDYVRQRYGHERVAQIGTIGKLQARAAVLSTGRAMQVPFPVVMRYSKMIPNNPAAPVTLSEAMKTEPLASELEMAEPQIKRVFAIALKLEGLFSHSSTHAAGVVIGNRPIDEIVPVMRDSHGSVHTQFDMKSVEAAGLVKFDFLGLKTLDVIQGACKIIAETGIEVDFDEIGVDDISTYEMLAEADSYGVFQLESSGMRSAMRQIMPTNIDDVIALVSLYRPGPMESIPQYALVKHGKQEASYLHPLMQPILKETYGIIIYQEQVMELARKLAGYSLGQADLLRRAMGKKIKSEMDKQTAVFLDGCAKNGIAQETATAIFNLIERFANYGFNKSHAAAYAIIAYRTAWLRRHYPNEFFAACMNMEMGNVEKLAAFYHEARSAGLTLLPPDINTSRTRFTVERTGANLAIRYALAGLRGVGEDAMERIISERSSNGRYKTLGDFVKRTVGALNRKAYESLIKAGALDSIHGNRASMLAGLEKAMKEAQSDAKDKKVGQTSLFDSFLDLPQEAKLPDVPEMGLMDKLQAEYEILGMYLTDHPIRMAARRLKYIDAKTISEALDPEVDLRRETRIGAVVVKLQVKQSRSGEPMGIITLSDQTGLTETVVFGDDYNRIRGTLREKEAYIFTLGVGEKEGERRLYFRALEALPLSEGLE